MENKIEVVRKELAKYFDPLAAIPDSDQEFISPSGLYLARTVEFKQADPNRNWTVTKYDIYETQSVNLLFTIYINHDVTFHNWFQIGGKEYFVCAEDIYGGQTIIDLTNRMMQSFSQNEDGFISTEFHLSPAKEIMATSGCFWAGPGRIKVFDFRNPMVLPWPEIPCDSLFENDENIVGWEDQYLIKVNKSNKARIVDISGVYREFLSRS